MKGSPEVIAALNECLNEIRLSYIVFAICSARCLKCGYENIGCLLKNIFKKDLETNERLANRILYLDGLIVFKQLEFEDCEFSVDEMMNLSINQKNKLISSIIEGIELCNKFKDFGSRILLDDVLVEEEKHLAHIEAKMIQFSERGKA